MPLAGDDDRITRLGMPDGELDRLSSLDDGMDILEVRADARHDSVDDRLW